MRVQPLSQQFRIDKYPSEVHISKKLDELHVVDAVAPRVPESVGCSYLKAESGVRSSLCTASPMREGGGAEPSAGVVGAGYFL